MVQVKIEKLKHFWANNKQTVIVVVSALVLTAALLAVRAGAPFASFEAEGANLAGNAVVKSDSAVSGGKYVEFNQSVPTTPPPSEDAAFVADAETGDSSQWCAVHSAVPVGPVSSPVRSGSYSYKVEVQAGVYIYDSSRSEYANGPSHCEDWHRFREGDETWTSVSVYFPESFPVYDKWSLFTQFKEPFGGTPPSQLGLSNDRITVFGPGSESPRKNFDAGPVVRGQWIDMLVHHKWSTSSSVGFVEVFRNGNVVVPKTQIKTMENSNPLFLSTGHYRDKTITQDAILYIDEVRVGPSRSSVELQ